jgi:hypothetical protein
LIDPAEPKNEASRTCKGYNVYSGQFPWPS